jgi:glycosyltransferase involved in cell wall biosynthesis
MKILFVTPYLPGPPIFGGQRRIHGLMTELARSNDVSVIALVDAGVDHRAAIEDTKSYCKSVVIVPDAWHRVTGRRKRALQLGSLLSPRSWEWVLYRRPAFQRALSRHLGSERYDIIACEFVFMANYRFGHVRERGGRLVLDEHNVEYDINRRTAEASRLDRKVFNALNWRKLRREEVAAWRRFDACTVTSARDREFLTERAPGVPTAVIPNGVDVDLFRAKPDAKVDTMTLLFFGAMNYYPNTDAAVYFGREILPLLHRRFPDLKLRIVGPCGPGPVMDLRSDRVFVTGLVEDLRSEIERSTAVIAPLRIGGGTRLKILEGMAYGKPIISTSIGAEGLDAVHGRDMLLADTPEAFAHEVGRVLTDPELAAGLGQHARKLAEDRYSWRAAASELEAFYRATLERRPRGN